MGKQNQKSSPITDDERGISNESRGLNNRVSTFPKDLKKLEDSKKQDSKSKIPLKIVMKRLPIHWRLFKKTITIAAGIVQDIIVAFQKLKLAEDLINDTIKMSKTLVIDGNTFLYEADQIFSYVEKGLRPNAPYLNEYAKMVPELFYFTGNFLKEVSYIIKVMEQIIQLGHKIGKQKTIHALYIEDQINQMRLIEYRELKALKSRLESFYKRLSQVN